MAELQIAAGLPSTCKGLKESAWSLFGRWIETRENLIEHWPTHGRALVDLVRGPVATRAWVEAVTEEETAIGAEHLRTAIVAHEGESPLCSPTARGI